MSEALVLYHPAATLKARSSNLFGKDVANSSLFAALARYGGYRYLGVLNQIGARPDQLRPDFFPQGPTAEQAATVLATADLTDTSLPRRAGVLLRGQPYLSELAWLRRHDDADLAYSLVGLIHTIAPPAIREQIAASTLAPVYPWDALVCTSPSVQQAMHQLFEDQAAYLYERLGSSRVPRPHLPLIPLGVDVDGLAAQAASTQDRLALRQRLGVPADGVLVLWVGRLSYYEKAFPQAMFLAVQQAAVAAGVPLHFVLAGWFPNPKTELPLYQQAAEQLAPSVNVAVLNGNDPQLLAQCWAAADVFLSLVDNIQETFGLAPVEAMAAGLPVVASNWDGYRYTVRDGIDGFLVPTMIAPSGHPGERLAQLHTLGLETYQTYVGAVAQHTAVHIGRAAQAIVQLATSPELRATMGASGQLRARDMFSWPVVVSHYNALFAELEERRAQAIRDGYWTGNTSMPPPRSDPFADFRGFATHGLQPDQPLRITAGATPADLEALLAVHLNALYGGLHGSQAEAQALLDQFEQAGGVPLTPTQLLATADPSRRPYLETTLVWLAKLGLIDWLPPL